MSQPALATGIVYRLFDPRFPQNTRYVGQTRQSLAVRLAGHLLAPSPNVAGWIAAIGRRGRVPAIEAVHQGVPVARLRRVEREEIARYFLAGHDLLNEQGIAGPRRALAAAEREREAMRRAEMAYYERRKGYCPARSRASAGEGS